MALSVVDAAIRARLAGWTHCEIRKINDGRGDTPPGGEAFLVIQYPISRSTQISTGTPGANVYRHEGTARFVLNIDTGSGADQALLWLEELAALFRGKVLDGVRFYEPTDPVTDDRNDVVGWFTLSISTPFEHDIFG